MVNKMLRLEYNLKASSCRMKTFTELRGRWKKIKNVGISYRLWLKWSVNSVYESGTVFSLRHREIKQNHGVIESPRLEKTFKII